MNRQLKIDIVSITSFIIGTVLLLTSEYAGIRGLGALMHYLGAMVFISRFV